MSYYFSVYIDSQSSRLSENDTRGKIDYRFNRLNMINIAVDKRFRNYEESFYRGKIFLHHRAMRRDPPPIDIVFEATH